MYVGNGAYCYANSTSMLLASIGEQVTPGKVEVLTGVGLGVVMEGELPFFNNLATEPDTGISRALRTLGFEFVEQAGGERPLERLRRDLERGPVVLGPLDMGWLTYLPHHRFLGGVDHYVLAYAMDEEFVYLHDPAGYPCVKLSHELLEQAWKAERIHYARGSYRSWTAPLRVSRPAEEDIYAETLSWYRSLYRDTQEIAARNGRLIGRKATEHFAELVRSGQVSDDLYGHMASFLFQLGAKRALDFAAFFSDRHDELAEIKRRHAVCFGECHVLTVNRDWQKLSKELFRLQEVENAFEVALHRS